MTSGELDSENTGDKFEVDAEPSAVSTSVSSGSHKEIPLGENEMADILQTNKQADLRVKTNIENMENSKNKFFIEKVEEPDKPQENKNFTTIPRTPSAIFSEYNGEVLLRPPHQYGNRVVSATVSPSTNSLGQRKTNSTGNLETLSVPRRLFQSKNKKENMVLQLVLPSGNQNGIYENNNYLTTTSIDEILGNGHLKERPRSINSQQEFYTPLANGGYINRTYSAGDLSQYGNRCGTPGGHSEQRTTSSTDQYKPTPPEEKRRAFIKLFVTVSSILYALFIVSLGLAVYISDIVHGAHRTAEFFSVLLVSVAFLFILYLTLDIALYMRKKRQYEKLLAQNIPEEIEMKETLDGHFQFNITLPQVVTLKKSLRHHYCFNKDRHSTNFYLKVGAAAFCFGHLIHSGLLLGYQLVFLTTGEISFSECGSVTQVILDVIYPIYSFLLLFFIFKYSNIIINRNIIIARFAMMHCLSSSICFWIWTIVRETAEALAHYQYKNSTPVPDVGEPDQDLHSLGSYNERGVQIFTDHVPSPRRFTVACDQGDQSLGTIYRDFSPYLYPFSVEYSILVVGVLFLVWQNIGMCKAQDDDDESSTRQCKGPSGNTDNMESNVVVHVDCQSSNKGLFGGFMILVLTIVSTILFFIAIYSEGGKRGELGITVNIVTSLIILFSMSLACVFGYRQITKLDLNTAHHNLLDDVLLFICIPAYFFNGVFSIIPAVIYANVLGSINICLEVLQVLLQTTFILDGLRRSSNTKQLRLKKPGREMVIFLVICNVALWIMQTFEVKSHEMQDNRYDLYGKELWTILGHMCLPLMMFYRFHSSVCLGDIWKYAYEPSGH